MVNELRAVVKELGGRSVLGRNLASQQDLSDAIREGFPPAVVEELIQASGLTLKEPADALDLSARSLQGRRRTARLARFESDRLYRLDSRGAGLARAVHTQPYFFRPRGHRATTVVEMPPRGRKSPFTSAHTGFDHRTTSSKTRFTMFS